MPTSKFWSRIISSLVWLNQMCLNYDSKICSWNIRLGRSKLRICHNCKSRFKFGIDISYLRLTNIQTIKGDAHAGMGTYTFWHDYFSNHSFLGKLLKQMGMKNATFQLKYKVNRYQFEQHKHWSYLNTSNLTKSQSEITFNITITCIAYAAQIPTSWYTNYITNMSRLYKYVQC